MIIEYFKSINKEIFFMIKNNIFLSFKIFCFYKKNKFFVLIKDINIVGWVFERNNNIWIFKLE